VAKKRSKILAKNKFKNVKIANKFMIKKCENERMD
jgi:hypothetical protein